MIAYALLLVTTALNIYVLATRPWAAPWREAVIVLIAAEIAMIMLVLGVEFDLRTVPPAGGGVLV